VLGGGNGQPIRVRRIVGLEFVEQAVTALVGSSSELATHLFRECWVEGTGSQNEPARVPVAVLGGTCRRDPPYSSVRKIDTRARGHGGLQWPDLPRPGKLPP
jgi:hypothetical protein